MALYKKATAITPSRKCSSIGQGGRGRRCKISMSTMNKSKKRSTKNYRDIVRTFINVRILSNKFGTKPK